MNATTLAEDMTALVQAANAMREQTAVLTQSISQVLGMAERVAQRIVTERPERQPELMPLLDEIRALAAKLSGALQ